MLHEAEALHRELHRQLSHRASEPRSDHRGSPAADLQRWHNKRFDFDLYISAFVTSEAAAGDPEASQRRLRALEGIPEIELSEMAAALAERLILEGPLPEKAALDALHIAAAVSGGAEYLLTWNFRHLANAAIRNRIEQVCRSSGYEPPIICTPEELLEA